MSGPGSTGGGIEDGADGTVEDGHYHLRLYVAGQTAKSLAAMANLKRFCEEHLAGHYDIEVVDLMKNPQLAAGDQILAIPTLVRLSPRPARRIAGDLSDERRVLDGLALEGLGLEGVGLEGLDVPPAASGADRRETMGGGGGER